MNKFQKSLDRIKANLPGHDDKWTDEDKEHILTIMEALEKQIPKKPKNREGTTYFYFPCCDSNNIYEHCGDCGQALDWSDTE